MAETHWLFDSIVGFLKSPPYTVPGFFEGGSFVIPAQTSFSVLSFIDDHCIVFDDEQENKFAFTDVHKVLFTMVHS